LTLVARIAAVCAGLLALVPFATGCYTVIRHPQSEQLVRDDGVSRKACVDCHQDSPFYHDAFGPYHYGFGSLPLGGRWYDYYDRPWWFRDHWYYDDGHAGPPVETGTRHMWDTEGRRGLETRSAPPVITGGSTSGGAASSGSPVAEPPANSTPPPATPAREDQGGRSAPTHRDAGRRELSPTPEPPPQNATPPKQDERRPENKPPGD
jgi:hypothetical protein